MKWNFHNLLKYLKDIVFTLFILFKYKAERPNLCQAKLMTISNISFRFQNTIERFDKKGLFVKCI